MAESKDFERDRRWSTRFLAWLTDFTFVRFKPRPIHYRCGLCHEAFKRPGDMLHHRCGKLNAEPGVTGMYD